VSNRVACQTDISCVYFDEALGLLQHAGVDSYIGHLFVRALAYADDLVLLALAASAMRHMLATYV
jgi:hypothetical protein